MSVRRALVDCAVLSVQDSCLFYPCCKGCFSRIDVEQQDRTRCRCARCGYSCVREQVDYRYRLSLTVAHHTCIFGVTVFGTCLNPFFGIHASGLRRLVENMDGPVGAPTKATLLMKAVKDCFIGRHFIFGIKRAAEYELGMMDPSKTCRPPETTLLLAPHQSQESTFSYTFSASRLLSLSLQRSQHGDSILTPTPPWQQSLGLVTSSAEQEEDCSSQVSADENSLQVAKNKTLHHVLGGFKENQKVTEERTLSTLFSPDHCSYSTPSFSKNQHTFTGEAVANSPILNPWFSPSECGQEIVSPLGYKGKLFSTSQLTKTFSSSSLAWEDLPFSESLSEFLCEKNKEFDIVGETKPCRNVQNQSKTVKSNQEIGTQDKNMSTVSAVVFESNTKITASQSRLLLDITNTPASTTEGERHDLSGRVCRNSVGCVNKSKTRSFCFHQHHQKDEETISLSPENEGEQLDTYDCSADLFSSSPVSDTDTKTLNLNVEATSMTTDFSPPLTTPDKQHLTSENANGPHATPNKQILKMNKCMNGDSLIPSGTQSLEFMPPAQSTPIVKVCVVSDSPVSSSMFGCELSSPQSQDLCTLSSDLPELNSKKPAKIIPSVCKRKRLSQCGTESTKENLVWNTTSSRHNHKFTPKKSFWKPDKHKNQPLAQQHLRRRVINLGSTVRINHQGDSSFCDVTACDYEDNEVIVPPTPAKTRRKQTENSSSSSSHVSCTWKAEQRLGVSCKENVLDLYSSSQTGLGQKGSCDSEIVDEGCLNGSNGYLSDNENQTCDWSRDLFSNSM
ncbi:DNA damage-induced apoptosis suppressor protein isoform X2 [Echeneis naucrates]|uniref:DNA damage-induced apoptosis suppressor protein isoform X2 n=1 Tax=Echeneis naucrates TaxID=173247 RepID=UPI001113D764|nr:DNA damage-induced apoptosis suppressor protein isoform X2 [Echeneis naucrates]